ncbi:MAG: hypothetical protein ABSC06_21360 [Rhodopila sp.]|jgi:spore maturation protein CgeB
MKFVLYAHSVVSDWNNGNAHFLRGILSELERRGHATLVLEPEAGWSRINLISDQGTAPLARFLADYPHLHVQTFGSDFDHETVLDDADVVVVHEWTPPGLVTRIGRLRRDGGRFTLLFHDTHHPGVSASAAIAVDGLRCGAGIRRNAAKSIRTSGLGPPGVHLARSGGHADIPAPRQDHASERPGLDRQLG